MVLVLGRLLVGLPSGEKLEISLLLFNFPDSPIPEPALLGVEPRFLAVTNR